MRKSLLTWSIGWKDTKCWYYIQYNNNDTQVTSYLFTLSNLLLVYNFLRFFISREILNWSDDHDHVRPFCFLWLFLASLVIWVLRESKIRLMILSLGWEWKGWMKEKQNSTFRFFSLSEDRLLRMKNWSKIIIKPTNFQYRFWDKYFSAQKSRDFSFSIFLSNALD